MSRHCSVYATFLIVSLALTVNSAKTNHTAANSETRTLTERLTKFMSNMGQVLRSVASTVKSLEEIIRRIDGKLNSSVCAPEARTHQPGLGITTPKYTKCREGWTKNGSSCFTFIRCPNGCTADGAKETCLKKHARLAKVASVEQQEFFSRSLNTSYYIILGGNDRAIEGTWRWPDGSLMKEGYEVWFPGPRISQPNGGQSQNCMFLDVPNTNWKDMACSHWFTAGNKASFICEMSPTSL